MKHRWMKVLLVLLLITVWATAADINSDLLKAAKKGDTAKVKALLKDGADPNTRNERGSTPLSLAATKGHDDAVKILLNAGADVDPRDGAGRTPLMWAAGAGYAKVVRLLVDAGADVNASNEQTMGSTVLMRGVGSDHVKTVRILLEAGADVNAKHMLGGTALGSAKAKGNKAIIKLLEDAHAKSVSTTDLALLKAVEEGDTAAVQGWLAKGANPNVKYVSGEWVLMSAAEKGQEEAVRALLEAGAGPNVEHLGGNPLIAAAFGPHIGTMRILMKGGADIDAKGSMWGKTPLMTMSEWGSDIAVRALLEVGADVNMKNSRGATALSLAKKKRHTKVIELLKKAGAKE